MVRRGFTRRCPLCGAGGLFRAWVRMTPTCPGCGLRFLREAGAWTGDLGLNTIVSFGTLLVVMVGTALLTWPTLNVGLLVAGSVLAITAVPIGFYPISKTLWLAFDLSVNPLRPGEAPGRDREVVPPATVSPDHEPGGVRR